MSEAFPYPALPRRDRVERLQSQLLAWFAAEQRDLPWRRTEDPYAIWISEAMLQQTRVATVIDYWQRFLQAFPTVQDLAAATEDEVLAAWSGLGYYRRARALRLAAQAMVERHGGVFPVSRAEALKLPGVGPYTAGAVLSIAYNLPEALLDGNVERVLTRLVGAPGAAGSGPLSRYLWRLAEHLLPAGQAGAWNQALMELGALLCSPTQPNCGACPWSGSCVARKGGSPAAFPAPKLRKASQELCLESLWMLREGRLLLVQRPMQGALAGMWELPTRRTEASLPSALWESGWPAGLQLTPGDELLVANHAITHHRIRFRIRAAKGPAKIRPPAAEFDLADLPGLALTGITKKALAQLLPTAAKALPQRGARLQ